MNNPQWNPKAPECPFDNKGNMLHYPEWYRMNDGGGWKVVTPFMTRMSLVGMQRGRSAAYFLLMDENQKTYTLFMADMEKILRGPGIVNGQTPVLEWEACKKGQNFGIKWSGRNYKEDT